MRYENTGNKITKISVAKEKVTIYFGKEKMTLSYDTFTSHYLYEGKELSQKEIRDLEKDNKVSEALKYGKSLFLKGTYTEWKVRDKLYSKEYTKDIVDAVVLKLKDIKLIDDKKFIKNYIAYGNEKLMGQNKIVQNLRSQGIFDENIKTIVFSDVKETSKAKKLLPKLERKYSGLSTVDRRQHIINGLIQQGYTMEIALKVASLAKKKELKQEQNNLKKAFESALIAAKRKGLLGDERKEFVFKKLDAKGYAYRDIHNMWEERFCEIY